MCSYSAVGDYGRKYLPNPPPWPQPGYVQPYPPGAYLTPEQWEAFKELLEKARAFDEQTGQPDCEDDEKTAWMVEVEERMKALEEAVFEAEAEPGE